MKRRFFDLRFGAELVSAFMAVMFLPVGAHAQLTRGSIAGTVRDETGP